MIARVAVFAPVDQAFDYRVPPSFGPLSVGARVWVPWGRRTLEGVVVALDPPPSPGVTPKPLARRIDAPALSAELVALGGWIAEYYCAPPGEVLRLMLPAGGAARARRRVSLTAAGRAAAAELGGALEPMALQGLDSAARALLSRLAAGQRPDEAGAALRQLSDRELCRVEEAVATRVARTELLVRPVATATPDFGRAPRRGEVYSQVVTSGAITLSALRARFPRAAEQVRALVAEGLVTTEARPWVDDPFAALPEEVSPPPSLTSAQAAALEALEPALRRGAYAPFLLHGVTGSGKTEVYLRVIAAALALGRTALVLVPEISLTPQLAARFRGRFGDRVAVLHSGLGEAARAEAWRRIQQGEVAIAVGARSAVFAPLGRLGVVVVDEEHDPSFKQEEGVRYHGRDVALVRARTAGAVALLGSATPALETFVAAREGRLGLISLPERATPRPLPQVEVIDLKVHRAGEGLLTAPLHRALAETLAAREQAILFLNRRGYSTFLLCKGCGQPLRCRDCAVSLTYHRGIDRLLCHYCGFSTASATQCLACGQSSIERLGFGTEQIEALLQARLPTARVARLDRDTAAGEGLQQLLDRFRGREIDILVGTQMVTKGHDFPGVTLVGVLLADQGMGLPDYRAAERTFQLLEQVAGRAGRGERPGRVLVQTYNPLHPAVTCARDHDYHRFAEGELVARREPAYPPHTRMACVRLDGADPQQVREAAQRAAQAARRCGEGAPEALRAAVLGPAEAPLSRLKGRTRWHLFLQATQARGLRSLARAAVGGGTAPGVRVTIDIDPISML